MIPNLDNPERWEERADEARAVSHVMSDEVTRCMMLEIARGYELLAQRARERLLAEGTNNIIVFRRRRK
jgi:hypothetical protein